MADLVAQAVLLLTAHLGKAAPGQPKPLGPVEYGRFAQWLKERELHPESLLLEDPNRVLADWTDSHITLDRVRYLLGRGAALSLAVEKWERAGLVGDHACRCRLPGTIQEAAQDGVAAGADRQWQPELVERRWSCGGWLA